MDHPIISWNNLSVGYRENRQTKIVAHIFSAVIPSFQLTCLIGSNGVGKSTLLRTLAGLQNSLSGELFVDDQPILSYSKKDLSKLISIVLTEKVSIYDMSVHELVTLGRSPYSGFCGKLSLEDKIIIEESIHLAHIETLTHRFIQTLSDGEKQKVMIAKTLAQQTPIIFLDEPTTFLDFQNKTDIAQLLYQINKKKEKTIFISTHDIELVLQISDTIWLMDKAKGLIINFPKNKLYKNKEKFL